MASSTSSFRVPDDLKIRLENAARSLKKGKSRIINEALQEYLDRREKTDLRKEARRQSILASQMKWKDQELWEKAASEVRIAR